MTPSSWVSLYISLLLQFTLYISLAPVQTIFPAEHSVGPHSDARAFGGRTLVTPIHEYYYIRASVGCVAATPRTV